MNQVQSFYHFRITCLFLAILLNFEADAQYQHLFNIGSDEPRTNSFTFFAPSAVAVDMAGNQYVADTYNDRIQVFNRDGMLIRTIGKRGAGNGEFISPAAIAVDTAGFLYVCDPFNTRIQVFDASGNFVRKFGSFGMGNGEFWFPSGVTIGTGGEIFVSDSDLHRIQVFSSSGAFLRKFGSAGSDDGEFINPQGLVFTPHQQVLVCDKGNSRIQVFTSEGVYLNAFGSNGSGDGELLYPSFVAANASGTAYYVSDSGNDRIQVFDSNFNFIAQWGTSGSGDGEFNNPAGIAVSHDGNVVVADTDNDRIQVFDPSGVLVNKFGQRGNASVPFIYPAGVFSTINRIYVTDNKAKTFRILDGSGNPIFNLGITSNPEANLSAPHDLTVDASGNIYITDAGSVKVYNSSGNFLRKIGSAGSGTGELSEPSDVTLDTDGNLYVVDTQNDRIVVFSNTGIYLNHFGETGTGDGQFQSPASIDFYDGSLYVVDQENYRIQVFDVNGGYQRQFGSFGPGNGQFQNLRSLTVNSSNGNIYVAEYNRIQIFDNAGNYLSKFGATGSDAGQFHYIGSIALTSSGDVLVAENQNARIQKMNSSGSFITFYGNDRSGDGQLLTPTQVEIDNDGNIYVADYGNSRVQIFGSDGGYIRKFGFFGNGDGQFNGLTGLDVSEDGNIYTTDMDRVQVFDNTGAFIRKFGSSGTGDGQFDTPRDVTANENNNIYVTDRLNRRVQAFDSNGNFLFQFGTQGFGNGQFYFPNGLKASGHKLFVADERNDVQVFDSDGNFLSRINISGSDFKDIDLDAEGNSVVSGPDRFMVYDSAFNLQGGIEGLSSGWGIAISPDASLVAVADFDESTVKVYGLMKQDQVITFNALASRTVTDEPFKIPVSVTSGQPLVFTSSNPDVATISKDTITIHGGGTTTITASHPGNRFYNAATPVTRELVVQKLPQTITFNTLAAKLVTDVPFPITATTNSGLPVIFSSSDTTVAKVSGNTVTIISSGTTEITAMQEGNSFYNAAPAVTRSLTINKLEQTVTFTLPDTVDLTDAPFSITASASSGLPVSFTSSNPDVVAVSDTMLIINGMGAVAVTATQEGTAMYEQASATRHLLVIGRIIELSGDLEFKNATYKGAYNLEEYVIKNTGNVILTVSDVSWPDFFAGPVSFSIPANGSISIPVTFLPYGPGNFSGEVTITSDAHLGENVFRVFAENVVTSAASMEPLPVSVSPNPGKDLFTITGVHGNIFYSVSDVTGKIIIHGNTEISGSRLILNMGDVVPGIYFLKLLQDEKITIVKLAKARE